MIGMGIDASTSCIGYSVFDNDNLIDYSKIKMTDDDWRSRLRNAMPMLSDILLKYQPQKIVAEDVPLKDGKITLVKLGATQGVIMTLAELYKAELILKPVADWRKDIGLFDGTRDGTHRDAMKIKSILKANELFNIQLKCEYTKGGNYSQEKSDDDIADAILIYSSELDKYKITKSINRRRGV